MHKSLWIALLSLAATGTASAAVNCASFPHHTINRFVNDDVIADGHGCTIGPMASINGGVRQTGEGGLVIRGIVNGEVSEAGAGDVAVTVNFGQSRMGDVEEHDAAA